MTSPLRQTAVSCLLALAALAHVAPAEQTGLQNYWHVEGGVLTFQHPDVAFRADVPRGYVSWQIGGDEFLHATADHGAVFFRRGDEDVSGAWTQVGNLSHDALLARNGATMNGVHLFKIITGWSLPRFSVYAGYNAEEDQELVVLLNNAVRVVRAGDPDRPRTGSRQLVTHDNGRHYDARSGCVVVHESGRALCVYSPCRIETVPTPAGESRLALVFPVKGHAANELEFLAQSRPATDNLVVFPKLTVSIDGEARTQGGPWGIYEPGMDIDFRLDFGWLGAAPFEGAWEVEFQYALGGRDFFRREAVSEDARLENGGYALHMAPEPRKPGVSDVFVRLLDAGGSVLHVERFRALYAWRDYEPGYHVPPDLREFWDQTLAALAEIPLEPKTERVFEDHPDWDLYNVSYNGWQGGRIHALLYVPKGAEGPLPTIVGSHPGTRGWGINRGADGVYGSRIKAEEGFVTLTPLIRGHEPDAEDIPFNQPWWGPLDSRDDYVARAWYCAMVRGIDYLATRPELADLTRLVARGGSQGGALALVTAALDKRVDWCLADSPSNCMLHEIADPSMYGSFGPTIGQVPEGQTFDDLKRTLSYYDPAHLAAFIECPTAIGLTVGDLTVHCLGGLSAYHNLRGLPADRKWFLPGINTHFHANSADGGAKFREILDGLRDSE